MSDAGLQHARDKMAGARVAPAAIETFSRFYRLLESGATGLIREEDVDPLPPLARAADIELSDDDDAAAALARTAIIKLNGGLGTSMGMERAKSLLPVRRGADGAELTFLDVIVGQVRAARAATGARLPLVLMNSFRTQDDSLALLARYEDLAVEGLPLDFLQNREPKLDAAPPASPAG